MDLVGESGRTERAEHIAYITAAELELKLFRVPFAFRTLVVVVLFFFPQNKTYPSDPGTHLCVVGDQCSPANGAT